MEPDILFKFVNPLALAGWLILTLAPLAPRLAQLVAGVVIPAILSLAYIVFILVGWAGAEGGFDSLADVMRLFQSPIVALAGWVHYLAFDLFVGAWQVRTARREGIPHLLILPCLLLTFLFGPAGLALFIFARAAWSLARSQPIEA